MRDKVKNLYGVEYASREDHNEKNMEKKVFVWCFMAIVLLLRIFILLSQDSVRR